MIAALFVIFAPAYFANAGNWPRGGRGDRSPHRPGRGRARCAGRLGATPQGQRRGVGVCLPDGLPQIPDQTRRPRNTAKARDDVNALSELVQEPLMQCLDGPASGSAIEACKPGTRPVLVERRVQLCERRCRSSVRTSRTASRRRRRASLPRRRQCLHCRELGGRWRFGRRLQTIATAAARMTTAAPTPTCWGDGFMRFTLRAGQQRPSRISDGVFAPQRAVERHRRRTRWQATRKLVATRLGHPKSPSPYSLSRFH